MLFFEVILRNLSGRRTHAALTVTTLTVMVAATILLFGAVWGFADASVASLTARGVDIVAVRAGVVERSNSSLRISQTDRVRGIPGIRDVEGTLTETVSLSRERLAGVPLIGLDPDGFSAEKFAVTAGDRLKKSDRAAVLLGAGLAQALGKTCGDRVEIEGTEFRVAGIFSSANPVEMNLMIAPLADVQQLMDRPGQASQFEIRLVAESSDPLAMRRVCAAVEALRDDAGNSLGLQALPVRDFVSSGTRSKLAAAVAWGTTLIAVAVSGLGVLNTMLVSVWERTREIGVLRAVGWPPSRIVAMFLGEAFVLACVSVVCGSLVAVLAAMVVGRIPSLSELTGPMISPASVAFGIVPAVVATALGALYPAWRASVIPATEALHYE